MKRIVVEIEEDMHDRLKQIALDGRTSMRAILTELLERLISKCDRNKK